jgi:protein involved in polysaccharide export with SLBB domain
MISADEPILNALLDVDWDGFVQVPLCGGIRIKDLHIREAEDSLRSCLRRYYKKLPDFQIQEVQPRNVLVKVSQRGETGRVVKVSLQLSVQSLLSREGYLLSAEQTVRLLSPYGLDLVAGAEDIQWTRPFDWLGGETLIVEKSGENKNTETIDVLGEVRKPGRLGYRPSQTVLDVIRDVQGPTPQADSESVVIYRRLNGEKIETRWNDEREKIQPGDVILIPAQRESTFDKSLRWSVSFLSIVNTLFLIRLSGR